MVSFFLNSLVVVQRRIREVRKKRKERDNFSKAEGIIYYSLKKRIIDQYC